MFLSEILSKIEQEDANKIMLSPLSNISGADIRFDKGYGTLKLTVPADIAHDLTNGSNKYVGGLLVIDRQAYEDIKKGD